MTLQTIRHQNLTPASLANTQGDDVLTQHSSISKTNPALKQLVYLIPELEKDSLTIGLLEGKLKDSVLIYVRTNFAADSLAEKLNRAGIIAESVHGNKSQRTKVRTLANFQNRSTNVVVATESATSVIVLEADMIINYDLPLSAETYGKRLARHTTDMTMKTFISLCDSNEQSRLANLNREFPGEIELIGHSIA